MARRPIREASHKYSKSRTSSFVQKHGNYETKLEKKQDSPRVRSRVVSQWSRRIVVKNGKSYRRVFSSEAQFISATDCSPQFAPMASRVRRAGESIVPAGRFGMLARVACRLRIDRSVRVW